MFVLLTLLAGLQLGIFNVLWASFVFRTEQELQWSVAQNLARELEAFPPDTMTAWDPLNVTRRWLDLNPRIDIYLVNEDGLVVADFGESGHLSKRQVRMEPIHRFLGPIDRRVTPILGTNPRHPDEDRVFSAAPVRIGGRSYYVYVVLLNDRFEQVTALFKQDGALQLAGSATGVAFLVVGLLGFSAFYLITSRVRALTSVLELYAKGDLDARAAVGADDELGTLARSLNGMADSIAGAMTELGRRDKLRRELIASVSHDLRGPVGVMTSYLELVERSVAKKDIDKLHAHVQTMGNSLGSLRRLLEELFDLAKLEAKEIKPTYEPFSAEQLIDDVALSYTALARARGIELRSEAEPDLPTASGDIALLGRVITNLVENALRHTPRGGKVILAAAAATEGIRISVEDTGTGIPETALPHIFEKFYQVEDGARPQGASGLGLAIVRTIVEAHRGMIEVRSSEGTGTIFSFVIPSHEPPSATAARDGTQPSSGS